MSTEILRVERSPELQERINSLKNERGAPVIYWVKMSDLKLGMEKVKSISTQHLPIGKLIIALATDDGMNAAAYVYERTGPEIFEIFMPIMEGSLICKYSVNHVDEDGVTIWQVETFGNNVDQLPPDLIGEMVTSIPFEMTKVGLLMNEGKVNISK